MGIPLSIPILGRYPKRIKRFEYKLGIVDTLNTGEFPTFSDKLADQLAKVMQEIELMKQHC
ncbi:MAG: hypothetical protein WAM14_17770 [Candidatus Nitrosopolaris sp.]